MTTGQWLTVIVAVYAHARLQPSRQGTGGHRARQDRNVRARSAGQCRTDRQQRNRKLRVRAEPYIVDAGMGSGEFMDATATAANWAFDRRDTDPTADTRYATNDCDEYGIYTPIQIARGIGRQCARAATGLDGRARSPNRQDLIAKGSCICRLFQDSSG